MRMTYEHILFASGGGIARLTLNRPDRLTSFHDAVHAEVPDSGGTYFLPRLVGHARALGLSLLGDKLTAEQAAQWGLIWQCVEDAELPAVTEKLLAHFGQAPTRGLAAIKEALQASASNTL